jgi:integrase
MRFNYDIKDVADHFKVGIPTMQRRDLKQRTKNSWLAYFGYDPDTKKSIRRIVKAKNVTQALEKAQVYLDEMRHNKETYGAISKEDKITFAECANKWIACRSVEQNTLKYYKSNLKNHLIPFFGIYKLDDIKPYFIEQYQKMKKEEISVVKANKTYKIFKLILNFAIKNDFIRKDPTILVKLLDEERKKKKAFDSDEVKKICDTAKENFPRYYPLLVCGFLTGMRPSELFGLNWEDIRKDEIDLKRAYTDGKLGPLKNKKERTIPYDPPLKKITNESSAYISKLKSKSVFCTAKGYRIHYFNFYHRVWQPLIEKAGVRDLSPHSMRHTYASTELKEGTSLSTISEYLGHHSVAFTAKTYCHFLPKKDKNSQTRLAKVFGL